MVHIGTDHNMAIMRMKLDISKLNAPKKARIPQMNTERFSEPQYSRKLPPKSVRFERKSRQQH